MKKENQENILDRAGISFHRTLSFKLFVIGMLVIILIIPKVMILELIKERSDTSKQVINEVMLKWSDNQTITGPVLFVPFNKTFYQEKEKKYNEELHYATFLPENLAIAGKIIPEKLNRSIYDVFVYESELTIRGTFNTIDFETLNVAPEDIVWENAELQLALTDLRGISKNLVLKWNNKEITFSPGMQTSSVGSTGVSIPLSEIGKENLNGNFEIVLKLRGSKNLMFCPVGETTVVDLESSWNDPGFTGNFLPTKRQVDESGFKAHWNVLHFNRNYPQKWISSNSSAKLVDLMNSTFGVELIILADHYQKNMRSAKYAILIILIVFTLFFMFEVFTKQRIHPFQYIMVGSALSLFYLLLLSVTEHLGFNKAYLLATLAVTLLVFFYSRGFMPKIITSLGISAAILGCFGFIFILLQLESLALLAGSIGLFVLLAALMYATRNVNWYKK